MNKTKKTKPRKYKGDVIRLRGSLEYALRNSQTGEIVQSGADHNVVLTVGRAYILNRIGSTAVTNTIDRIFLGTDATAESSTHAGVLASFGSKSATTINASTGSAPPYYEFIASWASSDTHASSSAINEFGLYSSEAYAVGRKTTASTINFGSTNTLTVTYRLSN